MLFHTGVYIHYGHGRFYDESRFKSIEDIDLNYKKWIPEGQTTKPRPGTGLWASDIASPLNWRALCYYANFERGLKPIKEKDYFLFKFKQNANVVHIWKPDDLNCLPHFDEIREGEFNIVFKEAREQGIDAIELHLENEYREELEKLLFGWDCSSIIVLNPNSIEQLKLRPRLGKIRGYEVF